MFLSVGPHSIAATPPAGRKLLISTPPGEGGRMELMGLMPFAVRSACSFNCFVAKICWSPPNPPMSVPLPLRSSAAFYGI